MLRRQVCIALNPLYVSPTTEFLKHVQWCSRLYMPGGPGVPQVVESKIFDPSPRQRLAPSMIVGPSDWPTLISEDVNLVTSRFRPILLKDSRNSCSRW